LRKALKKVRRAVFNANVVGVAASDEIGSNVVEDGRKQLLDIEPMPLVDPVAAATRAAAEVNRRVAAAHARIDEFVKMLDSLGLVKSPDSDVHVLGGHWSWRRAIECRKDGRVMFKLVQIHRRRYSEYVDKHYRVAGAGVFCKSFVLVDSNRTVSIKRWRPRTTTRLVRSRRRTRRFASPRIEC
jgi:hypothetical protein